MKVSTFRIENVKRVRTVEYEPAANGLTIIGGNNAEGKTSILDAIAWALGGAKYAPASPQREGSALPPHIKITMDNGIIVERKGKNSDLTVTDPTGARAGQRLLDSFIEQLALDLPKFMNAGDKEKADTLLKIIGVGDQLKQCDKEINSLYNQRHAFGQIVEQKTKYAMELPSYPEAPLTPVSSLELIQKNAEILARNGENQRKRNDLRELIASTARMKAEFDLKQERLTALMSEMQAMREAMEKNNHDIEIAQKTVEELQDESTDEIQAMLHDIDATNTKVRANQEKERAKEESEGLRAQYDEMSSTLDDLRKKRTDLLNGADLPLPGLGVEDGCLTYKGHKWSDMSGSEQLIVATSIVRKLNPQCQFVLMDKLEQMDLATLQSFGEWLKSEGLQVIATRVSTGDECQIIIEDGMIKDKEPEDPFKKWR